jgi:nitrogen fixation protein NifU and related proteins
MNLYKEEILDHYKHPHNFGDMADKTHSVRETNMACGDMVEMYLKVKDGVVEKAGFRGLGCALSTAMASMLTDEVVGKTVKEIGSWDRKKIEEMMGEVNLGRIKCVELPMKALKKALDL